jgi:hypothetical protein
MESEIRTVPAGKMTRGGGEEGEERGRTGSGSGRGQRLVRGLERGKAMDRTVITVRWPQATNWEMVRQPSPTNAGTCRGENAGDGDKSQPSPEACLGFYKIRKKGAPVMRGRGQDGQDEQTVVRVGSDWLAMGGSIASHQSRKYEGPTEAIGRCIWRVWNGMMDDEGLLSLMSYVNLGDGCLRIRCQRRAV